jgi:hypothetical protein
LLLRLREILQAYDRVKGEIPACLVPLMKPFIDRVEEAIKPGLVALSWSSLNVDDCEYSSKYRSSSPNSPGVAFSGRLISH